MEELTYRQFVEVMRISVETTALPKIVSVQTSLHKPKVDQYDNLKYKDTNANLKQHLKEL